MASGGAGRLMERPLVASAGRLFEAGPFQGALARLPGGRAPDGLVRQAIGVALIAWVPLLVATVAQDGFYYGAASSSLMSDFGIHARYLVALPLLVLADVICGRRLTAIAHYFANGGMVTEADRARFDALIASTQRWCTSGVAALAIVVCTYALLVALLQVIPSAEIPFWHQRDDVRSLSAAGWWHLLVSAPLLLGLLLAWLWRLLIWTLFLIRIARSPIRLYAAHPDRAAGLKFVGYSVRAYAPIGAALGALLAGRVANNVWYDDSRLASYQYSALGLIVLVVVLFGAPLLAFTPRLMREWRDGVFTYGKLAEQVGFQFEDKWFRPARRVDPDVLEASDFSAAIDLSSYVATVFDIRLTPADMKSFVFLCAATAVPFVPVILLAAPLDVLAQEIARLLF